MIGFLFRVYIEKERIKGKYLLDSFLLRNVFGLKLVVYLS